MSSREPSAPHIQGHSPRECSNPTSPVTPKALAQLPVHTIQGIAFDVDGTISDAQGKIPHTSLIALERLRDHGIPALAATGRPLAWAQAYAHQWPILGAVGENGAAWCIGRGSPQGHVVQVEFHLPQSELHRWYSQREEIRTQVAEKLPQVPQAGDALGRACDLAFDIGESYQATPEDRTALQAIATGHGVHFACSSIHAHFSPTRSPSVPLWDKATGISRALESALGVSNEHIRNHWVFVGDSGNDAEAFAWFTHSVGVANVLNKPPNPLPQYVTPSAYHTGFTELVDQICNARTER